MLPSYLDWKNDTSFSLICLIVLDFHQYINIYAFFGKLQYLILLLLKSWNPMCCFSNYFQMIEKSIKLAKVTQIPFFLLLALQIYTLFVSTSSDKLQTLIHTIGSWQVDPVRLELCTGCIITACISGQRFLAEFLQTKTYLNAFLHIRHYQTWSQQQFHLKLIETTV